LRWAYEQEGLSFAEKAALMSFALHSDRRRYTWPGVDHIASTWQLHRTTVRRAIEALLVRHRLCRTKKRRGETGQVKVYRLPKITYESGLESAALEKDQSGHKADTKRSPNSPEQGTMKKVRTTSCVNGEHNNENTLFARDTHNMRRATVKEDLVFEGKSKSKSKQGGKENLMNNPESLEGERVGGENLEAPPERGYRIDGKKFVKAEIANKMFANNPNLKCTPA
jgi:hypothetical protein